MNFSRPSNKKIHRLLAVILLTQVLFFVCSGCGNTPDTKNSLKEPASSEKKPFAPAEGYLPAFYLSRAAFLNADDSVTRYKDKLVLQVQPQKGKTQPGLTVFTIADSSKMLKEDVGKAADSSKIQYPQPFANVLNLAGKNLQMVDQRTREDEYQQLLKEIKKYPFINYVLFIPEVEGDHVRFKITGVEKLPLDMMAFGFATTSFYSRSF